MAEKVEWLQKVAQEHVDKGQLTKPEKALVLNTLAEKATKVEANIEAASGTVFVFLQRFYREL